MTGQLLDFNQARRQGDQPRSGVDADDIRTRLHADARGFVEWLYSGRAYVEKNGARARIGDVTGTPGASLSIALTGPDQGLWKDHATNEGGDLIALYRASMGYRGDANFVLSLKEIAKEFLGDPVEVERSQWQPTAMERIEKNKTKLGTQPRPDLLELGAPVATYTYYDTRNNVLAAVVRYEPDGTRESKTFRPYCFKTIDGVTKWVPGAPDLRPLYRIPDIALAATVVLCEGEGCADALNSVGIVATSAMQGASAPIEKTDWSPLHGKTVIIWPDHDEPGFRYGKAVAERLSAMGCSVKLVDPKGRPEKWDAADCVAAGEDAQALVDGAFAYTEAPKPAKQSRIRLLTLKEMESLPPLEWLVQDILPTHSMSMIWGRSGAMKSFVALDLAMSIATGRDWHGRSVKKGRSIYIAAEGAYGLSRRAIGWRESRGKGFPEPDFLLVPQGVSMCGDDLLELIDTIVRAGDPPAHITIDTVSRTFVGNPNQPADMNLYVASGDRLRDITNAHITYIHHAGEDEERNEVGNKGLRNACDTVIYVKRQRDKIVLVNENPKGKQKDADEFRPITLRPVKIFYQKNGEEQSTLILNQDEDAPEGSEEHSEQPAQRLGSVEKKIVTALKKAGEALGLMRLTAMTHSPKGTVFTSLENLVSKGLLEKTRSDDGSRDEWRLI